MEQPKVNNPRTDVLARCGDGTLRHVEFETQNRKDTPRRQAEYYVGFHRLLDEHVEQVLLFASRETLTMPAVFKTPSMQHDFRILDLKTWDGEPLIASEDWGDNIMALLTTAEQERILVRVEEQLHKLRGEEQQNAANILTIVSGIMGLAKQVTERIGMIDIMENEVLGPAIRKGIAQGLEQGITQGLERGLTQGERKIFSRQLARKFGSLPKATLDRIQDAPESDLLNWADRLLTAATLDEVFG